MGLFIFVAIIGLFLFDRASKHKDSSKSYIWFHVLFVLFMSLFAGLRDLDVGYDMEVYGERYFRDALNSPSLLKHLKDYPGEYGFHTFMWVCSRISADTNIMMVISEVIKISFVASCCYAIRRQVNPVLFMLMYIVSFYFQGMNIMRQVFAMGFFFYSIPSLFNGESKKYMVLNVMAMLMHTSAFMGIFIFFIKYLSEKRINYWIHIVLIIILFSISASIMIYIELLDIGTYSEKALLYMEKDAAANVGKANLMVSAIYFASYFIFNFKKYDFSASSKSFYFSLLAYYVFFIFMSLQFEVAFRLSWYILPILSYLYLEQAKQNKKRRMMYMLFIVAFCLVFYFDASHGMGNTIPFKSKILGL